MKRFSITLITLCMVLTLSPLMVEADNSENVDLEFLPLLDNDVSEDDLEPISATEASGFTFTLDNMFQATDWKDQSQLVLKLPRVNNENWRNLSRLGMRGGLLFSAGINFNIDVLLNAYSVQHDDFNGSDDLRLDLKEAYVSWQQSPTQFIDIGRINIKNGVATGLNPTDYFKVGAVIDHNTEDVSQLRDARLGTVLIKGQKLWDGGSLTLLASPKMSDKNGRWYSDKGVIGLNVQKSNAYQRSMLVFTHKLSEDFSPEHIYYNESGNHNLGLNVSKAISNQWLSYVEWSVGKRRNLIDEALLKARSENLLSPSIAQWFPDDKGEYYQHQFVMGASYTSALNITTNLEYLYNEAGLSKTDVEDLFTAGVNSQNNPMAQGQLLSISGLAKTRGESFGQHTLFLRSNWLDAGEDGLNLTGLLFYDLNDDSYLIQAEIAYELNSNALWSIRVANYLGHNKSNYGSIAKQQTATLLLEYSF